MFENSLIGTLYKLALGVALVQRVRVQRVLILNIAQSVTVGGFFVAYLPVLHAERLFMCGKPIQMILIKTCTRGNKSSCFVLTVGSGFSNDIFIKKYRVL